MLIHLGIIYIFLTSTNSLNQPECEQTNPCSCVYPDGESINLTTLNISLISNNFSTVGNAEKVYFYHPCEDAALNISEPSQKGVLWLFTITPSNTSSPSKVIDPALVLNKTVNGTLVVLGTAQQASFLETRYQDNTAHLDYVNDTTVSRVQFDCVANVQDTLTIPDPSIYGQVSHLLVLRGPTACPREEISSHKHLSPGSVLLVIVLTAALLYLICGALALKWLRGAEGFELIPNHDFWAELPGLVRDGVLFALSCGRTRPDSYERI